ncbi:MAG: STAS domain-containing protein [Lachnospiraceae bacterium]|nr:STAS domain-containing protein [Lachnospiraceae bacterium]
MNDGTSYQVDHYCLIVGLPEEVDHHSSQALRKEMEEQLGRHYVRRIVFDFSKTRFMDSSGIGVLLGRYKEMKGRGGDTVLCGLNEQIRRILKISGIPGLMPCCEDWQTARDYRS